MADEKYTIPENPLFLIDSLRRIQNSDPVNAEEIVNPILERILEALAYLQGHKATLGTDGKVSPGQLPEMDYDKAGSAARVKSDLDGHTDHKQNPHGVTAAQAGALPITGGTLTGKTVFSQGLALTAGDSNPSMPFFLGILPFDQGGDVQWITAGQVCAAIGASAASHTHTAADVGALPLAGGTITGNLRLKGSGSYGNKLNFGDSDYVHISEPTDDKMEIKAKAVNFVTANNPGITVNGGFADTNYDTVKFRGISLLSATPSTVTNGCVAMVYS